MRLLHRTNEKDFKFDQERGKHYELLVKGKSPNPRNGGVSGFLLFKCQTTEYIIV